MKKRFLLWVLPLLAFASCNQPITPDPQPAPPPPPPVTTLTVLSGTVGSWTLGERVIQFGVFNSSSANVKGTIKADGSFQIDLPNPSLFVDALAPQVPSSCSNTLTATPSTLKIASSEGVMVLSADATNRIGTIYQATPAPTGSTQSETGIGYVYADQDATVTGKCGGANYDLKLKLGWNATSLSGLIPTNYTLSTTLPANLQWKLATFN